MFFWVFCLTFSRNCSVSLKQNTSATSATLHNLYFEFSWFPHNVVLMLIVSYGSVTVSAVTSIPSSSNLLPSLRKFKSTCLTVLLVFFIWRFSLPYEHIKKCWFSILVCQSKNTVSNTYKTLKLLISWNFYILFPWHTKETFSSLHTLTNIESIVLCMFGCCS